MAEASRYGNVVVLTNSSTLTGQLVLDNIKVCAGSANARLTLTSAVTGTPVIYDSGVVTASTATYDHSLNYHIIGGDVLTVSLTGTGATAYAYIR